MPKFRKRPVIIEPAEVEAWRWNGKDDLRYHPTPHWVSEALFDHRIEYMQHRRLRLYTLDGKFVIAPGDWITIDGEGNLSKCPAAVFERTYQQAAE